MRIIETLICYREIEYLHFLRFCTNCGTRLPLTNAKNILPYCMAKMIRTQDENESNFGQCFITLVFHVFNVINNRFKRFSFIT